MPWINLSNDGPTDERSAAPEAEARVLRLVPGLVLFAPLALLGNEIGSLFRYPDLGTAVLFPPYAVLTAAFVASHPRDWVWYILVGGIAHFATHWPEWSLSWVLFADVANIVRALVAALMLRSLFHGRLLIDSIHALALFVGSAVLVAPAIGATLGATNVVLHGASATYWRPWSAWFLSNALTGLTMLPAFVIAFTSRWTVELRRLDRRRYAEILLLTLALFATCVVAFLLRGYGRWHLTLLFYAPVPVLIWAGLRFGPGGASLALTVVVFAAIWGADRGTGPFLLSSPGANVLIVQFFVLLTTVPVLCIAAVSSARRSAVQLYRALLASLEHHVAILDARGDVLEVSESWRRFADTDGSLFHRAHEGDNYLQVCRAAAEQGHPWAARAALGVARVLGRGQRQFEMEYDHDRDGRPEWFAMSVEALERFDGGAVVTRANVTARRRAQGEIEEQRRELSHLARVAVLGQLSGALAHELNQPLTSILSNAEAAQHLLARQPADLEQLDAILRDIVSEDQRAAHVIHRLRALLKRGDMRLQPLDPGELVKEVLELSHGELITRRVTATSLVEPNMPTVLGDRVQLQQVLLNLILNACEAMSSMPDADRRLSLAVRTDAGRDVLFSIRDCGSGIPPTLSERLFEPFVTTKPEGLGLGLSISRTIVAAHGGRLWAENNVDGGATMHCLFAHVDQPRSEPDPATPVPHAALSPDVRHRSVVLGVPPGLTSAAPPR